MASHIVKIKTYLDNQPFYYGTGCVVENDLILTANHVLIGDSFTVEDEDGNSVAAVIEPIPDNKIIGMLRINGALNCTPVKLTRDFIVSSGDNWELTGYLTSEQGIHYVAGERLNPIKAGNPISDLCLSDINVGRVQNYRGLSGSPVYVDGMIIGIAQEQVGFSDTSSDILISSTKLFDHLLPKAVFQGNIILIKTKTSLAKISDGKIDQNINSAKYIPDIFVEDGNIKECIRFFADSNLFKDKIVKEYNSLDFKQLNKYADKYLSDTVPLNFNQSVDTVFLMESLDKCKRIIEALRSTFYKEDINDHSLYQTCVNTSLSFEIDYMIDAMKFTTYQFVLLLQKAGQGKTNFVCDFTYNFLKKKDYLYLYINAYEFSICPKQYFLEKITSASGKDINYTLNVLQMHYKITNRPMIIVIDGLNENTVVPNFAIEIYNFLDFLSDKPYIRVLMTTRNEFFEERFFVLKERLSDKQLHIKDINRYYPNELFKGRLFDGYIHHFDITVQEGALIKTTFDQLSENPLLLRFFCEVNKGKKSLHLYHIYQYTLFQRYLENKLDEYRIKHPTILDFKIVYYSIFDKIANYMINNDIYYNIPITIFDSQEHALITDLILNDILFKDEHKVKHGIISADEILISFTYDEFRDFYITTYVAKNYSEEQLTTFIIELSGKTIAEGVQKYLFFISKMTKNETLCSLLIKQSWFKNVYWENIYNLEENDLIDEDINNIFNRCFSKYCVRPINYLLGRFDTTYFKKINISMLYEVFNKYVENADKYNSFIRTLFKISHDEDQYYDGSKAKIIPYNKLLKILNDLIIKSIDIRFKSFVILTFYLYDLEQHETILLWLKFHKAFPNECYEIINMYNNAVPTEINLNIKRIVKGLLDDYHPKDLKNLEELYNANISALPPPPRSQHLRNWMNELLGNIERGDCD